jgi:hypothetical protein
MANAPDRTRFDPSPNKDGSGWHLRAKHPSGLEEHITGFASAFDAIAWLGNSAHQNWLKARGLRQPPLHQQRRLPKRL